MPGRPFESLGINLALPSRPKTLCCDFDLYDTSHNRHEKLHELMRTRISCRSGNSFRNRVELSASRVLGSLYLAEIPRKRNSCHGENPGWAYLYDGIILYSKMPM